MWSVHWRPLALLLVGLLTMVLIGGGNSQGNAMDMLIDDFSNEQLLSPLGTRWRPVSDQVMGGVSEASVERRRVGEDACLHLSGPVRLENNGGFIQASLDLSAAGQAFDASAYKGLRLRVRGNGEEYSVHLRSLDVTRPWQSYRASFRAEDALKTLELPFAAFVPYRLQTELDLTRLRRIGLVAIGRAFQADLSLCEISFYR